MGTVGLDTSRTYNKKQPPGGACADLFGGDADTQQGQQKKLNRMLSNVELGSDQEVIKEKKNEKVPEVAQTRIQKKSQPSVCPVTGETLGHNNTAAKESLVKTDKKTENNNNKEQKEGKPTADEKKEAKIVSVGEPAPPNAVSEPQTEPQESVAATKSEASPPSAPPPAQTDTATTATSPPVIPTTPASTLAPTSAPIPDLAPASTPAPISAPAVDTTPPPAPAQTSAPAPMKTRRVPPGGHTTAFW